MRLPARSGGHDDPIAIDARPLGCKPGRSHATFALFPIAT
jgi:hypothetical protein